MRAYLYVIVTGLAWGTVLGLTLAVLLALLSGLPIKPHFYAFMAGGTLGALWQFLKPASVLSSRGLHPAVGFMLALFVPWLVSLGSPWRIPPDNAIFWQLAGLILYALLQTWLLAKVFVSLDKSRISRRNIELSLLGSLRLFGFLFFSVMVLLPLYVLVMSSLKSQQSLLMNPLDLMPDFSQPPAELFRSYIELFSDFHFATYLKNAGIVSLGTVVITLIFAVPGAYAVSRMQFPGRSLMSRSILLIYLVPAIVLVIPLYAVFSQLGLRNSLTGLLIVYPATTLPVALYMLQGYFRGLPRELEEAGMMDGCSRMRVILSITLPLSLPALASVSLYVFMIAWNEFLFAFMFLDDPSMFTLSRGVVSLNSSEVPRQHLMAGAVVATLPILVIFLWAERFLVQGLTAGSVKG